ncbi:MAG TPA: hypothetical protein VJ894_09560, partial [Cryomorphaceae bacterium]|nr:hypothetical protein [Cryomorphaceae bacterium]
ELEIDLHRHLIKIFKLNKDGSRIIGVPASTSPNLISMPYTVKGHLIELEARINDKSYSIAFDSGSEVLLLDKNTVDKEQIHTNLLFSKTLLTSCGLQTDMEIRQLDSICVGLNLNDIKTVLTDFNKIRSQSFKVNGLIGYDLIAAGVVTINFNTRILQILPYNTDSFIPV